MKKLISNLPIRLKLTVAIVAASFLVLLFFSSAFVAVEIYSFRKNMINEVSVMANLLSNNAKPALMQKKDQDASVILSSLHAHRNIHSAYLFDASGKPVAQYLDPKYINFVLKNVGRDFTDIGISTLLDNDHSFVHFDWEHLSLLTPIYEEGQKYGSIYLLSDIESLYSRVHALLFGGLIAFGFLIPFSLLTARFLTRPIAEPLLNLVDKMTTISRENDFTVRAVRTTEDEVGKLVDSFNEMLTQIEIRDGRISDHQRFLEDTVSHRTRELRTTVSRLEQAKMDADSANQAKSQFLANMTHELRTPLIGVLGMNELLARTSLDKHQQSLVDTVQRSGEDLLVMINDILDFSKIEAGHMSIEAVDMNLGKVVEETTSLLAGKAHEKGLEMACHVEYDALWNVKADPVRIRQILLNLIGNAIKFTSLGSISVRVGMEKVGQGLGCFTVEVEDTGIGLNEEEQKRIFSAFVQVDATTTRQHGGTGLGLSIVQQLVELMGGQLSLESKVGSGSLFRVQLTLQLLSKIKFEIPVSLNGRRALVFDESARESRNIQSMLTALGLQVVVAASAGDAWYRLLADKRHGLSFDFAFLAAKAKMPDGVNLLNRVRLEPVLVGLKTVGLSKQLVAQQGHQIDSMVLQRPVYWSRLVELMVRSWQKLELVSPVVTAADKSKAVSVEGGERSEDTPSYKILLADDNAVTRELIRLSLLKYPVVLESVRTGIEVLKALEETNYDLVLMDCNMPEMDGIETTCKIRQYGSSVTIVALTAHADQRVLDDCKNAGMNDLLRKPFRQTELHNLIEKWLPIKANESDKVLSGGAE